MAMMMTELYDALIAAGAPEEKARAAAERVADYKTRFSGIESDLKLLKWTVAFILAGVGATVLRLYL